MTTFGREPGIVVNLHTSRASRTTVWASAFVASMVLPLRGGATEPARPGPSEQAIRRTLREQIFLDAQVGVRTRGVVYAEDALPGSPRGNDLRAYFTGQYRESDAAPFGGFAGIGLVGQLPERLRSAQGDPLLDPYGEFTFRRNVRLLEAHVEYVTRDQDRRELFVVRGGRLPHLDAHARLLLMDGLSVRLPVSRDVVVSMRGGRRTTLDGREPDQRSDLPSQLVAGGSLEVTAGSLQLAGGHRFEGVHISNVSAEWRIRETFGIGATGELVLTESGDHAVPIFRVEGDFATADRTTSMSWFVEAQFAEDPRSYGRAGAGPRPEDIQRALDLRGNQFPLDRLFLGAIEPNCALSYSVEHWIGGAVTVTAGGDARIPLHAEGRRSLRPEIVEVWAGPTVALPSGVMLGAEVRGALEDPGSTSVEPFSPRGDGERLFAALRLHAEISFEMSETLSLSLRPEVEGNTWRSEGPRSVAEGQTGVAAGLLATAVSASGFRAAARYGVDSLPAFTSQGIRLVHGAELWLGGSF